MANATHNRPLSPHLGIYKLTPTMFVSIAQRITGAAMYFGTILVAWWLVAAAAGPGYFAFANAVLGSIIGRLVIFGFTWALMFHTLNGIRFLVADTGHGMEKHLATKVAQWTLIGSGVLTLLVWAIVLIFG